LCATGKLVKVGNRTECALLELCGALGGDYTRVRSGHELIRRFPFSSDRKRMSSLTFNPGERCQAPPTVPTSLPTAELTGLRLRIACRRCNNS